MHIRTKGRLAGLAFLAATSLVAEAGPAPQTLAASPYGATLDAALDAAATQAQTSLPIFIRHAFDGAGNARQGAEIKVIYQDADGLDRQAWLPASSLIDGRITTVLPGATSRTVLARSAIRDWSLTSHDGRLFGAFTTRAALATTDHDSRHAMHRLLMENPLPQAM
ncbi:MAG: hypothetical protein KJO67_02940 [Silicimonas sp.]|nr:hypothetical protein [Silicimonas sp.]